MEARPRSAPVACAQLQPTRARTHTRAAPTRGRASPVAARTPASAHAAAHMRHCRPAATRPLVSTASARRIQHEPPPTAATAPRAPFRPSPDVFVSPHGARHGDDGRHLLCRPTRSSTRPSSPAPATSCCHATRTHATHARNTRHTSPAHVSRTPDRRFPCAWRASELYFSLATLEVPLEPRNLPPVDRFTRQEVERDPRTPLEPAGFSHWCLRDPAASQRTLRRPARRRSPVLKHRRLIECRH